MDLWEEGRSFYYTTNRPEEAAQKRVPAEEISPGKNNKYVGL